MKLSICMATYNRGAFIGRTLDSILPQMGPDIELVVVDGASPDETPQVMALRAAADPRIRYFRETENAGFDGDFDKAVGYARGEFCWLLCDDDLLHDGAVDRVLQALRGDPDLVVVNARVMNYSFSEELVPRLMKVAADRDFGPQDRDDLFVEVANYLSFIGGVVIRRESWQARDRKSYYGSLFVHMGVIFQSPPLGRAHLIAEPLISIRYGNAMWSPRGFEIWLFKWPWLVWSFEGISPEARRRVCSPELWRNPKILFYYRALGSFTLAGFREHLAPRADGLARLVALLIVLVPQPLANLLSVAFLCRSRKPESQWKLYSLLRSPGSTLSRLLFRGGNLPRPDR